MNTPTQRVLIVRPIAVNESAIARSIISHVAANVAPVDSDADWLMISPYGEFPNVKGKQIVTKAHAEQMVAAFNSVSGRMGRMFRGVPIYVGHPDVDPDNYPDKRRYGKIVDVQAREDGFYGKVVWNALGKENLEQGYYVYPSPAWYYPQNERGIVEPDELLSVGLTNSPQIAESTPWARNENPGPAGQSQKTEIQKMEFIKELAKLLGLDPETATEESITAAIKALLEKQAEATTAEDVKQEMEAAAANARTQIADLKQRLFAANQAAAIERKERSKLLLDTAINEGRILQADRAEMESEFAKDFTAAADKLAKKQTAINTREIDLRGARKSIATAEERRHVIQTAVNERQRTHGESYDVAYANVKRDPQYKAVFEAMARKEGATK